MGKRVFGLIPQFLTLVVRSRFVKQLRGPGVPTLTKNGAIAVLRGLLEAGNITPVIDSTYPLSEVREAIRHMIDDELRGKVIVNATRRLADTDLPARRATRDPDRGWISS